jgi:hypothetical protein
MIADGWLSGEQIMEAASIIVDMRRNRCGNCKVSLSDALATKCGTCGALFDAISSNHVGLADKLRKERQHADVMQAGVR